MCSKFYEFEQIPDFLLSPDFVFLLNHFLCVTDRTNGTDHWPIVYVRDQSDWIQSRRFMVGPWHSVMDQYWNLITTLTLNFWTLFPVLFCYLLYGVCGTSFVDLVLCLLCIGARLFICALWSPAGKGLTSWLSFVPSNSEFVIIPLVSWVRCGT